METTEERIEKMLRKAEVILSAGANNKIKKQPNDMNYSWRTMNGRKAKVIGSPRNSFEEIKKGLDNYTRSIKDVLGDNPSSDDFLYNKFIQDDILAHMVSTIYQKYIKYKDFKFQLTHIYRILNYDSITKHNFPEYVRVYNYPSEINFVYDKYHLELVRNKKAKKFELQIISNKKNK